MTQFQYDAALVVLSILMIGCVACLMFTQEFKETVADMRRIYRESKRKS